MKNLIFDKQPRSIAHDFFGPIMFMGDEKEPREDDYWEGEYLLESSGSKISILITAEFQGPSHKHVELFKQLSSNLDDLFIQCWPIFEPDFEQWTGKQFSGNWREEFDLMGISLPKNANLNNDWNVCYFVNSANHYFTAQFQEGIPKFNEIDG